MTAIKATGIFAILMAIAFLFRPPAAVRVLATTGSVTFVVPNVPEVARQLAWPISAAQLCGQNNRLDLKASDDDPDCPSPVPLKGSLWFGVNAAVTVAMRGQTHYEIRLDRSAGQSDATVAVVRDLDGAVRDLTAPARIVVTIKADGTDAPTVLPVVGRTLQVGEQAQWQALTSSAVLQQGEVMLVRSSLLGDVRFSSDDITLVLGDWLQLAGKGTDYVQGVLQITSSPFFTVALTASPGDAWLHRFARDPVHLDTPLALQLLKDPLVLVSWGLGVLIISGWLRVIEIKATLRDGKA